MAPFRVPDGVSLAPIDRETGEPGVIGRPGVILEAFKPGTVPTGEAEILRGEAVVGPAPAAGTGGLY